MAERHASPAELRALAEEIERAGFTPTDLARAAGMDKSTLSRYLGGSRQVARWKLEHLRARFAELRIVRERTRPARPTRKAKPAKARTRKTATKRESA